MRDLHELPKLRDSLSYLYWSTCRVEQKHKAVEFLDKEGRTMIPAAALAVLLLGPGTAITHAAVKALADNGCLVVWCGEDGMRCYAQGGGETRKAYHLLQQAELASDPQKRLQVVMRMYRYRFGDELEPDLNLFQIRGKEGARVRQAYAEASRTYGVPWHGRRYDRSNWGSGDPVNRALSAANALLNGLCHAAIVSGGYSPALGFIHTGKQLSFVYDIADLYKAEITIPLAFRLVAESDGADRPPRARGLPRGIQRAPPAQAHPARHRPAAGRPGGGAGRRAGGRQRPGAARTAVVAAARARQGGEQTMVVMVLEKVPVSLRGELTRWLIEPHPGVFVGHVNAMVRDRLWDKCCGAKRAGGVLQIWTTNTEQRFQMRAHGDTRREIVDLDGLQLIRMPRGQLTLYSCSF